MSPFLIACNSLIVCNGCTTIKELRLENRRGGKKKVQIYQSYGGVRVSPYDSDNKRLNFRDKLVKIKLGQKLTKEKDGQRKGDENGCRYGDEA